MDDLRFFVLFNSASAISGLRLGNNERLCALKPGLRWERLPPRAGPEPGTRLINQ